MINFPLRGTHRVSTKPIHWVFAFAAILTGNTNEGRGQTPGCTDPVAANYNSSATLNDGSCQYNTTVLSLQFSQILDSSLLEVSGLIKDGTHLIAHRDQGDNRLFGLDSLTGAVQSTYTCTGTSNYNWEEIAQDSQYIYVGDFGNNINGNRTDLRIYRIDKSILTGASPTADTIGFAYSTQTNFDPTGLNNTDFDCEAFLVGTDSIYLFTKRWVSGGTAVYALPKTPGTHLAVPLDSFNTQGYITGATQVAGKNAVVLCGYTNLFQPFIYLLYDFTGHHFFGGNKRRINMSLPFHQIEGVATENGRLLYLINEGFSSGFINTNQKLHRADLTGYWSHYLNPSTTSLPERSDELNTWHPNPVPQGGSIRVPEDCIGKNFQLSDTSGKIIATGRLNGTLSLKDIPPGLLMLSVDGGKTMRIVIR
jgi:hypothetical protein